MYRNTIATMIAAVSLAVSASAVHADSYRQEAERDYRNEMTHPDSKTNRQRYNSQGSNSSEGGGGGAVVGAAIVGGLLFLGCRAMGGCGASEE